MSVAVFQYLIYKNRAGGICSLPTLLKNVDIFYLCYRYRGAFQIEILGIIFSSFFPLYFPHLIINQYCGFQLLNTFPITSSKAFSEQLI